MSAAPSVAVAESGSGPLPAIAYVADHETALILRAVFAAHGWPEDAVRLGDAGGVLETLADGPAPRVIIFDLSESDDPRSAVRPLVLNAPVDSVLIGVGSVNDVTLYRDLRAAGLADYLPKPLTAQSVHSALGEAKERQAGRAAAAAVPNERGRLIVVTGVRGGVGASTVATNCAWIMAHELSCHTALLDLDLHFGTCALALDLMPGRGLCEALSHPERMDALFVASAMVRESEHLMVLGAEEPLESEVEVRPEAVDLLTAQLRDGFHDVIIDMPRQFLSAQRGLLAEADAALLVTDLSIAGVRDVIRVTRRLVEIRPDLEIKVVGCRTGRRGEGGLSRDDFEKGIERKLMAVVDDDGKTAAAAAGAGRAIAAVAPRSRVAKTLRTLAKDLSDWQEPESSSLFAKFKKKRGA